MPTIPHLLKESLVLACAGTFLVSACSRAPQKPENRAEAARALYEDTTRKFHIPSADAKGEEKVRLQNEAAAGYQRLLKDFSDQNYYAAQALRGLGNIRATQSRIEEAVKDYMAVPARYPEQRWECLMAMKSAADLLWDSGRRAQALPVYQRVVNEYEKPGVSQIESNVIRGCKMRLEGRDLPP